jgi:hypothetical protein
VIWATHKGIYVETTVATPFKRNNIFPVYPNYWLRHTVRDGGKRAEVEDRLPFFRLARIWAGRIITGQ